MILTLWLSLLALSLVVCVLGYFTDDEPYLTVGLAFFFLLSIVILTGQLQYQIGESKNTTFSYNSTILSSQSESTSYTYTAWSDTTSHIVGYLLAALSFIGITLSLMNRKQRGAAEHEE